MSKAHIRPAVAIRGCNTIREKTRKREQIVKDFIILNQVVSEKTLMKNVHMCYIRVTEGKIENLKKRSQNEGKHLNVHLRNTLCLSESVHKVS